MVFAVSQCKFLTINYAVASHDCPTLSCVLMKVCNELRVFFIFIYFYFLLLKDWNDILKEALGKPSADSYYGTEGTING